MAINSFYASSDYRERQRQTSKSAWLLRKIDFHYKRDTRKCARPNCASLFKVLPSDPKKYCSSSCAAKVSNKKRGTQSSQTKEKISLKLMGARSPYKGVIKVARIEIVCRNPDCRKKFFIERWKKTKFCSVICAMRIIGGQPTSPKAARAKAGIRGDISSSIYFYSRWEANVARLFTLAGIQWIHQPKTFDLQRQKYTPDFYLPEYDVYVEVKNFLGKYSLERDKKFRKFYPNEVLWLLLKEEYFKFEEAYSGFISNWEYKNSPFYRVT